MARQNKNDAEFFPHDADMRNDIKVTAIRRKFSHTGYAVWCFLLETLTDSEDFEMPYSEVDQELLAADYDVPVEELREIIDYATHIGLLQQEDGKVYSEALKRRFIPLLEARERRRQRAEINRQNGRRGGNPNFRKGQPNPYYQRGEDNQNITETAQNITEDNPKVKESKAKESKPIKKTPVGEKKNASRFVPPTIEEVRAYIADKGYDIDADYFVNYYTGNGWMVGKNHMKDWQATIRTWVARDRKKTPQQDAQSLGVGEYINGNGIRTYGMSGQAVPQDAPPRPSENHWWNDASGKWEKML